MGTTKKNLHSTHSVWELAEIVDMTFAQYLSTRTTYSALDGYRVPQNELHILTHQDPQFAGEKNSVFLHAGMKIPQALTSAGSQVRAIITRHKQITIEHMMQ